MTFADAAITAKQRQLQTGQAYAIVQVKNGQWMVERQSFLDSPEGRLAYGSARRLNLHEHQPEDKSDSV